jgi:hypothetical protein
VRAEDLAGCYAARGHQAPNLADRAACGSEQFVRGALPDDDHVDIATWSASSTPRSA